MREEREVWLLAMAPCIAFLFGNVLHVQFPLPAILAIPEGCTSKPNEDPALCAVNQIRKKHCELGFEPKRKKTFQTLKFSAYL
jgi:hypothetical protein